MSSTRRILSVVAMALLAAAPLLAQAEKAPPPPKPAPSNVDEVLNAWRDPARKIIAMAEDFPEDKYDYKPSKEVRSFAEQLLHIAGGHELFIKAAKGEKWTEADGNPPRSQYPNKAAIVAFVKKSFDDVNAYVKSQGEIGLAKAIKVPFENRLIIQSALWMEYVQHDAEHYGQLVVYYRLNGIVPPESRPRR